jgi:hypothetical protein
MKLKLQHVGPIAEAELDFGDLTVLVGPQATGKSIALQMLKLMVDPGQIQQELDLYGFDWSGDLKKFFDVYFGEGMHAIWQPNSSIAWDRASVDLARLIGRRQRDKKETLFYIPAQRVLTLREGWPQPFIAYSSGDPFAVREFSEKLRLLVEQEFGGGEQLFPQPRRLKHEFRTLLEQHVFGKFQLKIDKSHPKKRLVLSGDANPLPYMVWSAGQREFVPLLLGLYWLMPPTKVSTRGDIRWVVIEEPEMGLHARAISVVLFMVLELIARGYRVCLSTHSPQVLEAVWTIRHLADSGARTSSLLRVFGIGNTPPMQKIAEKALQKIIKVFYFDRETGATHDISALDPSGDEAGEAGWGGLAEFSSRANEAVAMAVANSDQEGQS